MLNGFFLLRNQDIFSARGNTGVKSNKARITPHHFDEKQTVVRRGRITNLINRLNHGVQGRVITDGKISAVDIIIDGTGHTNARQTVLFFEQHGTGERAITTDHHQTIESGRFGIFVRFYPAFLRAKLLTASRLQEGATEVENIGHRAGIGAFHAILNQALVALFDHHRFDTVIDASANSRTNGRIHTRSIAPGGQNTDSL